MHRVFLSLGSNMGDKKNNLDKAVDILKNHQDIHSVKVSSYYITDPVGYLDQDVFMNIAVEIFTDLNPEILLDICQNIEEVLHRKRIIKWGPRTIDVDILLYDKIKLISDRLTIPHERMYERGFVLIPLLELDSQLSINNKSINELIENIDTEGVRKI